MSIYILYMTLYDYKMYTSAMEIICWSYNYGHIYYIIWVIIGHITQLYDII